MSIDEQFAKRFKCPKCKHAGGSAKRIGATGTGLSRILDLQHNKYIGVSCLRCGFTEFYNPHMLEDRSKVGDVLDLIFGA